MASFDLAGRVAVVTGGYGVLGGSMAEALGRAGARVVVLGRNHEAAEAKAVALQEAGVAAMGLVADVLDEKALVRAREALLSEWGRVDILVNAAGGHVADLVRDDNPEVIWIKKLIALRQQHRALRVGNFRPIEADRLLAFERYTDRVLETLVVLANPSSTTITERVMIAYPVLMDDTPMIDVLAPADTPSICTVDAAFITVTMHPETALVLKPRERSLGGYSRYKRVR